MVPKVDLLFTFSLWEMRTQILLRSCKSAADFDWLFCWDILSRICIYKNKNSFSNPNRRQVTNELLIRNWGNFSFCKLSAAHTDIIRILENEYKSPARTNTWSHISIFWICLFFFLDVQRIVRTYANCCEWVEISAGTLQAQLQSPHGYQRPRKQGIAVLPGIGDYL